MDVPVYTISHRSSSDSTYNTRREDEETLVALLVLRLEVNPKSGADILEGITALRRIFHRREIIYTA